MSFSSLNRGERVRIIAPQRTKALAVGIRGILSEIPVLDTTTKWRLCLTKNSEGD